MFRISYRLLLLGIIGLLSTGCDVDLSRTARQTDAKVYEIIDRQWDDQLAAKANYRISDASEDSNSLQIQNVRLSEFGVLTMPQAVSYATGHNRQYHTEKETLYLTALDFTDVRHFYEPMPFAGADGGYFKDNDKKGTWENANLGFEQLLATGAQVGSNISLGVDRYPFRGLSERFFDGCLSRDHTTAVAGRRPKSRT